MVGGEEDLGKRAGAEGVTKRDWNEIKKNVLVSLNSVERK